MSKTRVGRKYFPILHTTVSESELDPMHELLYNVRV